MNDLWRHLLSVITSPVILLFVRFVLKFRLTPLTVWKFQVDLITFITATVGGFVAVTARPRSRSRRVSRAIVALVVLLVCLFVYNSITAEGPTTKALIWYDVLAYISYFGCFFAFGFCASDVAEFLLSTPKGPPQQDRHNEPASR